MDQCHVTPIKLLRHDNVMRTALPNHSKAISTDGDNDPCLDGCTGCSEDQSVLLLPCKVETD
eukprot:scaffold203615_cov21-Prasinocladus_malaysianus.AAC.1